MSAVIATVAVEKSFFNLDSDYDYIVPKELVSFAMIGSTVKIPFGKGNVLRDGIIVNLTDGSGDKLKEISKVTSDKAIISEEMVKLSLWMKERYFCTTFDCLKQMLPRGYGKIKDAGKTMLKLCDDYVEGKKLTPKQQSVVNLLCDVGSAEIHEVTEFCSVGVGVVKNLQKYGIVETYEKEVYRNPYKMIAAPQKDNITLSPKQNKAYSTYSDMMNNGGGTGLLFGVTGSGKTQVYLKLIDKAINEDKDVIVMVPEISLTPQTLSIFHKRYGKQVAVIHSGLSLGERNDEYKRLDRGEAKIAVGTRSAVFAPLHNLGLVIVDEEQENTYKSERTPRYNAKDVAKFRCAYNKALLLLISATPSIESYSYALRGKYKLFELDERYGNSTLPDVVTVDMKNEQKLGNKTPISEELKELIDNCISENKQAILLINRRGYNTFIACNECGHVITCPNCSISLTYHSYSNRLVCHYCGYSKELDNTCPECHSNAVRYSGFGTQRIEDELTSAFPNARVLRMDADTTSAKFSHEKMLKAFSNGEYDILVGTQMVAKGLDFPNVNLVGVINADNSLYDENYTASEKCFDLITQVVGRSGRRDSKGKAVIQTINPNNEILNLAAKQDYKSFFETEIDMRKMMVYPPFCDLISIGFVGENENSVALGAKKMFETIVSFNKEQYSDEKIIILGPSPSKIYKISNEYRYRLAIKCKNSANIRKMIKDSLKVFNKIKEYKDVTISVDVNPIDLT